MRLRFWIKQGLQNLGLILGASFLYAFLMYIQLDHGTDGLMVLLILSLLLFGAMLMCATTLGVYKLSVPLTLSFGSTRNEALLGLQVCRLIPTIVVPAIVMILTAVSKKPATFSPVDILLLGIGAFLLFSAVGTLLGAVFTKYGKIAAVATAISVLLLAFGAGFVSAFLGDETLLETFIVSPSLPWLILGIGLFAYSISMIPEQRIVWKCNVKL